MEADQWYNVNEDVKGQYYDHQLVYGCRFGMSTAAEAVKHSPATAHNTDYTVHTINRQPKWKITRQSTSLKLKHETNA